MGEATQSIGPYRILKVLGRGGMGVVYLAEHERSGEKVALKTVLVPKESMLQGIRREIHALARLRHPAVVRMVEEGVEQGLPWYAMELLQGQTVLDYCPGLWSPHEAPTITEEPASAPAEATATLRQEATPRQAPDGTRVLPSEGLRELLGVVRRLCLAMAYLHGEGVVHRDLKPGNVLVRSDASPVILDFGIVSHFAGAVSRESLEVGGTMVGTVSYMAPEQIRGDLVDARADLYALGCILYELLTGQPPFVRETLSDLVLAHLEAEPPAPSRLVGGLPLALDALVLKLLAKKPRDRLGHADDVASRLAELGAEEGMAARWPRPRAYLYRPDFCGRPEALEQIESHLLRLESGGGAVVLLGGESGVGKTRLAMEAARQARRRSMRVLTGECPPPSGQPWTSGKAASGAPLQALRRTLVDVADRCRGHGLKETERLLGRRGKVLAMYEPALLGLPGQGTSPGVEAQDVAPLPPEAARLRLFGYLAETLEALAGLRPLVLVLDDLQWADDLTLGFLGFVLRGGWMERLRVLIIGTYRSEEVGEGLREVLEACGEGCWELGRMEERALGTMVGGMLGLEKPPERFVGFLRLLSEGNPFFVAEVLRTAVEEGLLYRDEGGRWQVASPEDEPATEEVYEALRLPRSVLELVGRRLEALSGKGRRLAEAGAVLGREFEAALLGEVAALGTVESLEAVAELLLRQVLEEQEGGRLRFAHDKIREVAYGRIPPEARCALHRAAAEAIEARHGAELDEHLAALGHHWEQARWAERAQECYLAAARRSASRYAHAEAERLYRAALALVERPAAESVAVRIELVRSVLQVQGRSAEAVAECLSSLDAARSLGERPLQAQILTALGVAYLAMGRLDTAWEASQAALVIAREAGDRAQEGILLDHLATLRHQQGRPEEARLLYQQALDLDRERGDRQHEAMSLSHLAVLDHAQGRLEEMRGAYERVLAIHRQLGDRRAEGIVLSNLALLHVDLGSFDESQRLGDLALALLREVGDRRAEALVLGNVANLWFDCGRLEEACTVTEQALAIRREIGDRRGEAHMLSNLGRLRYELGRAGEARKLYEQALGLHRELGNRRLAGHTLLHMATERRQSAGRPDEAERALDEAESILEELGDALRVVQCVCERGHLAMSRDRPGRPFLEQAAAMASRLGVGAESAVGTAIARLRRATEAFEARELLCRGECIPDLPQGLRRQLEESGAL